MISKKNQSLPKLLQKTQIAVNKFVRERDKQKGCISCSGQVEQAGHYFSQGHHSALRFDLTNIHGQCKKCNLFLHGNLINYGQGIIRRYGQEYHDRLISKSRNAVKKWHPLELEEIVNNLKK